MNKNRKVTLKDILVSKVVRNIAIAVYLWMWARTDYKEYYSMIQSATGGAIAVFYIFLYMRERKRLKFKDSFGVCLYFDLRRIF